jgi:hypothetical protein
MKMKKLTHTHTHTHTNITKSTTTKIDLKGGASLSLCSYLYNDLEVDFSLINATGQVQIDRYMSC